MLPIQGATPRLPGDSPGVAGSVGAQPLSPRQHALLERLVARIVVVGRQQSAEVWGSLKQDLGLKNGAPLLSRHFPAAEQNLNQRLARAQATFATRQIIRQLNDLPPQSNHRQAVSHFIRQQFGQTALSQLTPTQLKTVLTLLQNNQLPLAQPRQITGRPLLAAEHNRLNQLVTRLAAATGESGKQIWQSMLALSGVKTGEPIPARYFTPLVTWLQTRQTLSQQPAPTLHSIQTAQQPPPEPQEWKEIVGYSQQRFQATPQTILTAAQVQDILHQMFLKRAGHQHDTAETSHSQPDFYPLFAPFIEPLKAITARPGAALIIMATIMILLWMVR